VAYVALGVGRDSAFLSMSIVVLALGGYGAAIFVACLVANRVVYGGWLRFPFTGGR